MLIDNFSSALLARLVCPVSRDPLDLDGDVLRSPSGFAYPMGDFRTVAGDMSSTAWGKGQRHYEEYNSGWVSRDAAFYRSVDQETVGIYREIPLTGDVLDVGGGFGLVAIHAGLHPSKLTCVDPMVCLWDRIPASPYKEHYANLATVARIPGYAEHLPFRNGTFDTVHMRSCLDHFANPHRALLEARRVLKPGGKLVVGLALEGAFKLDNNGLVNIAKRKLKDSVIGEIYEHFFDQHMFHPTEESLRALVSGAGFQINQWMLQEGYSGVVYLSATPTATPAGTASATP
jgi:ubiquinone/menaquinone biosynthesis C-methylase UbiE